MERWKAKGSRILRRYLQLGEGVFGGCRHGEKLLEMGPAWGEV
jgi:hypothetical protein